MSPARRSLADNPVEAEIHRLRGTRGRGLSVEIWKDGRCKISCATGMRIVACSDLEELLRNLPSDAPWSRIWSALFDSPEAPE